jgi:uncharacterized alkaline shock family protein YloU
LSKEKEEEAEGQYRSVGRTTIAPDVLVTIARLTALDVPGVSRMASTPKATNRLLSRSVGEGVRIEIKADEVFADIYLVLKDDVNIREVSRQVQEEVARAIAEMVGMRVGRVNIHVEDMDYSTEPGQGPTEPA